MKASNNWGKKIEQSKFKQLRNPTSIAPFLVIFTPTVSNPKLCNAAEVQIIFNHNNTL